MKVHRLMMDLNFSFVEKSFSCWVSGWDVHAVEGWECDIRGTIEDDNQGPEIVNSYFKTANM